MPQQQTRNRKPLRLPAYDYASPGAYFITAVTHQRSLLFEDQAIRSIVQETWQVLPHHFLGVSLDAFVVMPNHLHGIIVVSVVGARSPRPSVPRPQTKEGAETAPLRLQRPTLGQVVAYFKYQATKRINLHRGIPGAPIWQRNYYEHVVRDEEDLDRIRLYTQNNPAQWELDAENPDARRDAQRG